MPLMIKPLITLLSLILVCAIGILDYVTGPALSLSIFFLIPIAATVWWSRLWQGVLVAVASAVAWFLADTAFHSSYAHYAIPYWNGAARLAFFMTVVVLLAMVRTQKDTLEKTVQKRTESLLDEIEERKRVETQRERLIDELTVAMARLKVLKGLLPICGSCKKIRDDQGYWQNVEAYIAEHSEAEFTHGICPDCLSQAYRKLDELHSPVSDDSPVERRG
jgi:K+-sensing histidine kinase KdpD